MVRETRHLWVGNLPDNIREDRIREHFKRYGRVQSVKLLPRSTKEETGEGTMACTVAFMDIKSASKAHNTEHKVDDRTLTTEYYEPAAIPSSASPQTTTSPYSTSPGSTRFPNGHSSSDEHGPFSERFYERTNNARGVADGEFIRRGGYHDTNRSRNRDRGFRNGPYNVIMDRGSHRTLNNSWSYDSGGGSGGCAGTGGRYNSQNETGYTTTATTTTTSVADGGGGERRGTSDQSTKKKTKSRSGSRSPSPSGSASSRSPSRSRSRSSSSSSSSSTSRTSSTSTPKSRRTAANSHLAHSDDRRPLAICVRNLPLRSSDTSLKDGLYHEYKKHGKVTSVKVVGQNSERHAIVCFKKPEDVEKALEVSYDKLFFGCKIDVASYQGFDVEDNDLRPYEAEIDEFHPKATRTLFIGNLEKDTTASDLRKHFDQFGEIIEIDIKNQGNVSLYAFCQYSDIVSVVKAIRKMDGEHLGNNRIKLGFGKSMPTNVVWVDGIVENVNEKYLRMQFDPFGPISKVSIDRDRGQALIFYEQMVGAQSAVSKMRGYSLKGNKIQVDFASRECQQSFYEHLEKQGPVAIDRVEERRDSTSRSFDSSRFARYDTPTRPRTSSYSSRSSIAASQVPSAIPSPGTPGSVTPRGTSSKPRVGRFNDYYESGEVADRHFRSYDEYSQGSAASQDDPYDPDYSYNNHESPMHADVIETRATQSAISIDHPAIPYAPPDIRNLQKERVHLLEQLEDCPSSGDEHLVTKKRLKLDLLDNALGTEVIIEANRDHRKVMEVRRLSDVSIKHHSRRPSADNKHSRDLAHDRSAYIPHGICKRRKTGGSDSGSRSHHYDHSGSESVGGSRPGTPLCDERPENFQPSEPRRVPRERNGPLTLPLPRFASQILGRGSVSVAGIKGQKDVVLSSPPPAVTSPRISNPKPSSPVHVPPPASPPPRPPSLSSNSSDSENPPSPSLDERIKSLDEKYEKWSGSRALSAAGGDALAKLDATREKFRLRHKLLEFDLKEVQPSEIVKSVMAKRSVFDEDLKRLENVGEKYEPKDFSLFPRATSITQSSTSAVPSTIASTIKITSPSLQISSMLSPRSSGNNMIPAKGLQYPFPSHPPIQPATTTLLQQTPPATPSSIASPTPQIQTASTTTRSTTHGDNRLKSCASASSDNRLSSKVNVNRSVVLNNSSAPIKSSEKNSGNIPSDACVSASTITTNVETKVSRTIKQSDKLTSRRDSNNGSPRGDIKSRRNSDVGTRRTEDIDKFGDISAETDRKSERSKSEERKKDQQQKEKQRLESEMLERDRLEKEQQEKERLEKERVERERQEREKELEKERLEKEKQERERAERERLERENLEQAKREQERLKREREEQERLRREEAERDKALLQERQRKEREEAERKERELKIAEDERLAKKERQAKKERHEAEKLERERRREEEKKNKDDNHERRKEEYKHRENHGEIKHKDNNIISDKSISNNDHKYMKQGSKEEKDKTIHEIFRKNDSHDRNNSDKYNKHSDKDSDYRRKESIKENRDNNTHEKVKETIEIRHLSTDSEKSKSNSSKLKDIITPANVGIKRRMSSQDNFEHMSESKKPKLHSDHKKISERRDSKDSTRSDDKIKPKLKNSRSLEDKPYQLEKPNFLRESEEKRKEKDRREDRERDDKHRDKQKFEKQKSKSKSREKDLRESPTAPTSKELTDKDFLARLELRSTDDLEMQKEKRSEAKEKRRYDLTDTDSEKRERDEKRMEAKRKEKSSEKSKSRDDQGNRSFDDKMKSQKKDRIRKPTINSSDNSDSDEPRKHSIFDIVDDEPAYISMYDKVKARSCKNMQKQEEEKRQEKIKAKFSQLKQSRAKREEKKRSTSWDEDSDSDRERNDKSDSKSRRNKMLIISSDEESSDFGKSHKKRGVFTDSDSDRHRRHKNELTEASDDDVIERKSSKSPRGITETTSDEDYKNSIEADLFSLSKMEISSYLDLNIFKVKDEFRRSVERERRPSKQEDSLNQIDVDFVESKPPLTEIKAEKINNRHSYLDNSSADESTEFKKEKLKKHKKKQKRPKHSLSSEDSNKFDPTESSQNDSSEKMKHHDKKKQHNKKDKKRDKSKDRDKSKKSKRSKSASKSEFKHDGKMDNIFGSLSDSSENGMRDSEQSDKKIDNSFMEGFNDENIPSRYSDSDGEKEKLIKVEEIDPKDDQKVKKRKERRRKEKERLLQEAAAAAALAEAADHFNETSMDFADMGKQLEANIKDEPVDPNETSIERNDMNDQKDDKFNYYENSIYQDFKKEDRKEGREKKKKRKKSKEEKQKHHHHHHHHHHHEKNKVKNENKKETVTLPREEPSTPIVNELKTQSQSLPNLLDIPSPPQEKLKPTAEVTPIVIKTEPIDSPINQPQTPAVQQQPHIISPVSSKDKTRHKFIPGFGLEIDEIIHENAVKSISDFDAIKLDCPKLEDVKIEKPDETPEEKPRAVISQEETEDAVAALLGESFSNEFVKHYAEEDLSNTNEDPSATLTEEPTVQDDEEMRQAVQSLGAEDLDIKPETPQSEHELQIDTDTEEQDEISLRFDQQPKTPDMSELLHPPKTPDIPTYYRSEESKLTPSPLVIKTTPTNIGSPPSLAPITPQSSITANAKRNLDKVEVPTKMPPLVLPPLIEPTRTVISHPWATKVEETKAESKISVVTKCSPQVQKNSLVSTTSSIITTPPIRTSVVKISEPTYPPLTAISKQEAVTTKADVPLATIPILQVATPALHNLPARSPLQQAPISNPSQDLHTGPTKASISKIRLPITSVMVSKPLQPTTINLPQPKVAFPSEPPKLIPTQEARPRMMFQNAAATSFPFNSTQKMLVQTNIPVARGLLVPARPGHFNYIPSQVPFNTNTAEKTSEISKTSSPISLGQCSPTKIIQMKSQSIIISPNSHISPGACVINSPKVMKSLMPDNPPSLVAISSSSDPSSGIMSSPNHQTKVITSNSNIDTFKEVKKEIPGKEVSVATVSVTTTPSQITKPSEEDKSLPQKSDVDSCIKRSSDEIPPVPEEKEEKPEIKIEENEPQQKLAIETVTDELNQKLKEAMDSEIRKRIKEEQEIDIVEPKLEDFKPDINLEEPEEIKPIIETDHIPLKEPEKVEEEKTDSESIVSDISKDCSSADMPIKDLLLDGKEDKEDSDYWSPKDVNIDSVIKTLCSADELSNHSNDNISIKEEDHPKEEDIVTSQKEQVETESNIKEEIDNKDPDNNKSDVEPLEDSVEDDDKEVLSRIATRRGGRGRGRKARGGLERGGIQTRRAKVLSKEPVTPTKRLTTARGGRAKVERKVSKPESETPTDIYEFREDEENRPRLILTIKQSNTNSAAVQSAIVKEIPKEPLPVQPPPKPVEVKEKSEDFTQPSGSTNTRKSKRLQEKDISRTTVDDTIEDVVKNVVTRSNSLATRRSTRQPAATVKVMPETQRKSTRGRRIGRRASETTDESLEEKEKIKTSEDTITNTSSETSKVEVEKPKEPTPLNPTVTEKEEIKQPQVPAKENLTEKPPIGLKAAVLRRIKGEMGQEPMTLIDPVTGLLTPMRECEENKYIPVPGENKPGSIPTSSQPSTVVTSNVVKPMQQTVITSSQQSSPVPTVKQQSKPQSLKAHVLSSQAAQAVVTQQLPPLQKQNAVIVSSAPSALTVETKMNIQQSQNLSVNVTMPSFIPAHLSPRPNLAVASGSPKPATVKQPVSSPSQMYNLIPQQMMQINKSSPAAVVQKGIVSNSPIMSQQSIIKQVPISKAPIMPRTTHPMHIPAGVPSSVLGKVPSQTMVTNASRLIQGKNLMEPPKVDVSLSNLMSVRGLSSLSPQGQPRHHPQSSMPVSGYEASLAETIPHFPPGSVTLRPHDLPPPHYMHPSHVMYQQYLRQSYHFPRSSVVSGGIEKTGDGQEGEEAPVTSPPLELRIANTVGLSLSSRGAAVPHSLHSPHDRATDSPQIGQVYNMPTARMQHFNMNRYYEPAAEPPPAHRPVTSHSSLAALGSDRPPLSHMAALGAPDRPLVSHLPPDRPLGSHLAPDRPLGSHLPPDRPLSGHSALTGHLPLGNPERPSSSHLPPDRPMSSHLTPDRLSGISTPDRPVSAHTITLGAGLGAAGNLMGAVARHIGVDAPTSQRGLQAATPPHASQVPPQAESLNILLKQYPKMWQGLLALKNDQAAVHMYYVSGNDYVAKCSLPKNTDGSTPPLRIFQRMRLEPPQVEGVARKMQMEKEHCMLLALPCGMDHMDVLKQSNNLTNGFIHYLQQKQAAGIVNVAAPGTTQPPAYVVHIFPTCSFVEENLRRIAPSLLECVSDIAHLLIVITTV